MERMAVPAPTSRTVSPFETTGSSSRRHPLVGEIQAVRIEVVEPEEPRLGLVALLGEPAKPLLGDMR